MNLSKVIKKQRKKYQGPNAPRALIYDIETCLLKSYMFQLGEQTVRHTQLLPGSSQFELICINYLWLNDGNVQTIAWEPKEGTKGIIRKFDEIIKQADLVVGKNSNRFDNKMINSARMLNNLPGLPQWIRYTDDLERQMRKYFRLPSFSLDYISDQFGLGGKNKMEFKDWINISQYMEFKELSAQIGTKELGIISNFYYKKGLTKLFSEGKTAFNKMIDYGRKDVLDTEALWLILSEHFESKFNRAAFDGTAIACRHCGGLNLKKDGTRTSGRVMYQEYHCNDCGTYAGRSSISPINKKLGKIQ